VPRGTPNRLTGTGSLYGRPGGLRPHHPPESRAVCCMWKGMCLGATAINFTQNASGTWSAVAMSFKMGTNP
jgi:hypothetical protein